MNFTLISIGILFVLMSVTIANETEDENEKTTIPRVRNRCPFIKDLLKNGRVKIRSRGRIAKFICDSRYELVGSRFATCARGRWNKPIPICVTGGCSLIQNPLNGLTNVTYGGALLAFKCDPGYVLNGSANIYCNGTNWNDTAPTCDISISNPKLICDFEESSLCGWTNDRNHDFDWRRHQFSTPSGHVGTGPSYDHTMGKGNEGYYMYIEASSPRKQNDTARLFSPVYSSDLTPGCFVFWYHMYGATTGTLRVFMKKESQIFSELTPVWEKEGEQGNLWLQSSLSIPKLREKFQLIIEGVRGNSYVGDTAIDDVALYSTPCEELSFANITKEFDSCQGRCNIGMEENSTCYCSEDCLLNSTCCDDYENFCTKTANRTFIFGPEPQPKPIITTNQPEFSVSTFTTAMATEESRNTPKMTSITTAVNATIPSIQPYPSTSNNFTKLTTAATTLLNSTFTTALSNKSKTTAASFQTERLETSSTSPFKTPEITNKTSELTSTKLEEDTTSIQLSNATTINPQTETFSFAVLSNISTVKDVTTGLLNVTEQLVTPVVTEEKSILTTVEYTTMTETTTEPETTLETTAQQAIIGIVTNEATTAASKKKITRQNTTTRKAVPKNTTQIFTTRETTTPTVTLQQFSTTQNLKSTQQKVATPKSTTQQTEETTTTQTIATEKTTESLPILTTQRNTVTSQKSVAVQRSSVSLLTPTKAPNITESSKTTRNPTTIAFSGGKWNGEKGIIDSFTKSTQKTTQRAVTKASRQTPVNRIKTSRLPVTKPKSIPITTTVISETTAETTTAYPLIPTTLKRLTTSSNKIRIPFSIPTFTELITTKELPVKTSTRITTTAPKTKRTRTYPTTKLKPAVTKVRKTTVPFWNTTTKPTIQTATNTRILFKPATSPTQKTITVTPETTTSIPKTTEAIVKTTIRTTKTTTTTVPKTTVYTTETLVTVPKTTESPPKTNSSILQTTLSIWKTTPKTTKLVEITTSSSTVPSETSKSSVSKETTELNSNKFIDYSSRTKKKIISRRPSKANSSSSLTVIVAVTVGIAIIVLFLIAARCFCIRKRKTSQNKLAEDSEMKFLSDNEILEYSDPSLTGIS